MKKLFLLFFLGLVSISSIAQNLNFNCDFTSFSDFRSISDFSFYNNYRYSRIQKNQIFLEFCGGLNTDSELYFDLGLGWRHHFNRYLAWDILTVKALTSASGFLKDYTIFLKC